MAYMRFELAGKNGGKESKKHRCRLSKKLSPRQVAGAKWMGRERKPKDR
jgi:hypothetical protein